MPAYWFGLPKTERIGWLYLSAASGAGIIAIELWGSFDWLFQLAGAMVILKLSVLLLVPAFWDQRIPMLIAALVIGSVGSHMPGSLRHFYYITPPGRQN